MCQKQVNKTKLSIIIWITSIKQGHLKFYLNAFQFAVRFLLSPSPQYIFRYFLPFCGINGLLTKVMAFFLSWTGQRWMHGIGANKKMFALFSIHPRKRIRTKKTEITRNRSFICNFINPKLKRHFYNFVYFYYLHQLYVWKVDRITSFIFFIAMI